MNRRTLPAVAILSVLLVGLLSVGFVSRAGIVFHHAGSTRSTEWDAAFDAGRVRLFITTAAPAPGETTHLTWVGPRLKQLDVRRALWEFDAHSMRPAQPQMIIIACSLWCLMVPLFIVPTVWWRRRHAANRKAIRGFSVMERLWQWLYPVKVSTGRTAICAS